MQQRYLGATGLKVSEVCLGTMTFGRETDESTSRHLLDHFVSAGGTFIDTADVYTQGASETIVGRWLKERQRNDLVIATKVFGQMGVGPNEEGLSRKHILAAVDASLRRLQTDYIDLYQLHAWDVGTPLEETLGTLQLLVHSGKVRYIGTSNVSGWQLQKTIDLSRQMGWEVMCCVQPQYNLLCRTIEWELLPVCAQEDLGILAWSPLRGGWLSGKYGRGMAAPPEHTRVHTADAHASERWSDNATETTWQLLDTLAAVAAEVERTPAQVAINWLLCQPQVTTPIIGARTLEQLKDNLGAAAWRLTQAQQARLSEASASG